MADTAQLALPIDAPLKADEKPQHDLVADAIFKFGGLVFGAVFLYEALKAIHYIMQTAFLVNAPASRKVLYICLNIAIDLTVLLPAVPIVVLSYLFFEKSKTV